MRGLVKLLNRLLLVCVIATLALLHLQMAFKIERILYAFGSMREQLKRSGLEHVTAVRGIPQSCREEGFWGGFTTPTPSM
ncbi:hypothetical protein [Xanthomonas sp. 3058]|uniref:hypothetical protein n=1 Tax=Xanthomonas sp. 3058 TaxID=3035314 RepID=UPI001612A812|nr:hypothetical protein [Xanthomonas sp. 3058]MBB5866040.1 hypothetical protein [Xanthomonas sp. 3058]